MSGIVSKIKSKIRVDDFDLATAEGRAEFDRVLRGHLAEIEDELVRRHAGDMMRPWRKEIFEEAVSPRQRAV